MAESDRLLSDCTPFKGVPRVQIPLSPPVFFFHFDGPPDLFSDLLFPSPFRMSPIWLACLFTQCVICTRKLLRQWGLSTARTSREAATDAEAVRRRGLIEKDETG